jgi:beta-galactosidase
VNTSELKTAGKPARIKLSADRTQIVANNQDLSYITVELLDARDVRNPNAENLIHFSVTGPGSVIGVGNANPRSLESYSMPQRKGWQGRAMVIIKSGRGSGPITVTASSPGLRSEKVMIQSVAP